jgi:ABC-type polysaccharide/polyol phosphate transport system ATPase subunit
MSGAIRVEGIRKAFQLPHEQRTTFKEYFLNPFKRIDYETQVALEEITFTIEQGEFFGVIGPNGSGKSTLLKIVAGIYRQDAGRVVVSGRLSPFIELGVGFNPELTARDNVRINGTLLGMTRRELDRRFESIVAFAELERFVDQKLKNFSSGMQMRLAYSIAIQVEFDILLLDEVLAVGDAAFQAKCFDSLAGLRAAGKTILYVTHDLASVEHLCDRALLLVEGRQTALGPAAEVVEAYVGESGVAPQPAAT